MNIMRPCASHGLVGLLRYSMLGGGVSGKVGGLGCSYFRSIDDVAVESYGCRVRVAESIGLSEGSVRLQGCLREIKRVRSDGGRGGEE